MVSYLGSLVQFNPAAGRAGRCRQMSLCVRRTRRVLARQPTFSLRGERPGQPGVCARSPPGAVRLFPQWRVAQAARGLAPSPRAHCGLFPLRPQRAAPVVSQKSLDRNPRLFAGWEGVASLGLSLPLAPPPASFLQRGWGGSSLEFLSPFVLRTAAVCSGRLIFPRSPTV